MTKTPPPLIVIVGETASGKSSLAMEIARRVGGEIISADSWAIYKGMDIGTAKPSKQDQDEIPHHLIDIVEPDGDYTAALFKRDAIKAVDEIHARGRVPIMAGGTGLYVDSVLFDFGFLKTGNREKRKSLNQLSIEELIGEINQKGYDLTGVDTRNKRRLIRVIESEGSKPTKGRLRKNTLVIGIRISRSQLRKNIENRVESMFRQGLRREVERITSEYGWDCEGMQGIGYREFKAWHEGAASMTKVKSAIAQNTLSKLAKHQRTWFKKNPHIEWFDGNDLAVKKATEFAGMKDIIRQ